MLLEKAARMGTVRVLVKLKVPSLASPQTKTTDEELVRRQAAIEEVNAFFADDWAGYQQAVEAASVSLFETFEPLELEQ